MAKKSKKFDKGIRLKPTNENTALSGELSVSSVDNKLKATLESYADYTAVVHNVGDKVRHTDKLNYVCIQTTTGAEDPSNASFWTVTERSIVTEDQTQTLTNKTIDATDATGTNTVSLDASDATYDNTTSGLTATDAQAAIDENDANLDAHIVDAIDAHDASAISFDNVASGLTATEAQAALDEIDANLDAHLVDAIDAHDASSISFDNVASGLAATETQAAIDEVEGRVDDAETAMSDHLADAIDAHDASAISSTAYLALGADNVQSALEELQDDIDTRALNTDLTAHENETTDAHASSAISYDGTASGLAAGNVKAAIDEVDQDLDDHKIDTTTHGTTSDIVGKDDAQTLTNKTIAAQIMTGVTRNSGVLKTDVYQDAVTTGADATMAIYGSSIVRLEHASLTSLSMVASPEEGKELTIINATGVDISIKNDTGGTAANRILTGTKADIALKDEASITIKYDDNELRWMVVGGVGGEGGGDTDVDVMFVDNFDATTIGDYTITGAASITDNASEVVNGEQSLKLDHNGSPLGSVLVTGVLCSDLVWTLVYSGLTPGVEYQIDNTLSRAFTLASTSGGSDYIVNTNQPQYIFTATGTDLWAYNHSVGQLGQLDDLRSTVVETSAKRTIPVPNKFKNKNVRMEMDVNSNATSGNITVDIVDETNVVTIVSSHSIEPFNGTGSEKRTLWFDIPETCASLSYEFTGLIEASAITIIDDIQIEKEFQESTQIITDTLLKENEFSARIQNNGTSSITSQNSTWIQSVSRDSAGITSVTFVAGFFSIIPALQATTERTGISDESIIHIQDLTTSGCKIKTEYSFNGVNTDYDFSLQAQRQASDYDANLVRRIETKDTFSEIVVEQDRDISEINEFAATIANTGTASVISDNASFIQSVNTSSTGVVNIVYVPGLFSVTPVIIGTVFNNVTDRYLLVTASTTSGATIKTFQTSSGTALFNQTFNISVERQGSDVYNKTLTRIKTNPNQKIKIPSSEMRLEGSNSRGTGAETFTVKFDSLTKSIGGDLLLDNANGAIITCKKDGLLSVASTMQYSVGGDNMWITKNQAVNTTSPLRSEIMNTGHGSATNFGKSVSATFAVKIGDKIRLSSSATPSTSSSINFIDLYFQEQEIQVGVSNILPKFSETDACIDVYGYTDHGSDSGNNIVVFSTMDINNPNDKVSYVSDSVFGDYFEILEDGTYTVSGYHSCALATLGGISLNASNLNVLLNTLPQSEILAWDTSGENSSNYAASSSITRQFVKGDIIRYHTTPNVLTTARFTISQVGKPNITSVDVTPFVDLPLLDTGSYKIDTFAGYGSSNTKTPYFTNVTDNNPNDIFEILNDSTNGFILTVIKKCSIDFSVSIGEFTTNNPYVGIVKNSSNKSANIYSVSTSERVAYQSYNSGENGVVNVSVKVPMEIGDTLNIQTDGNGPNVTFDQSTVSIFATSTAKKIVTEVDSNLSDWADYTPTVQGFGVATVNYARWKVFGDSILLMASISAGTVDATLAQITLPNNLLVSSTSPTNMFLGLGERNSASIGVNILSSPNNQFLSFGATTLAGGLIPMNGNQIVLSGENFKFSVIIPIEGLSSEAKTLVAIKDDKNFAELRYHGATSLATGVADRIFSGVQGYNNGISLETDGQPQIKFTKKAYYKISINYRQGTDVWTKWGLRTNDNLTIEGESGFEGGAVNSGFSFIAKVDDISQTHKLFSSCSGAVTIINPSPSGSNIGDSDTSIHVTIEEIKPILG